MENSVVGWKSASAGGRQLSLIVVFFEAIFAVDQPEVPSYYGFTDVHGFKDYLGAIAVEAPDLFMEMDWLPPDEQMNLERAFIGLGYGFDLVAWEFSESKAEPMRRLAAEALMAYRAGDDRTGQSKLEQAEKLLRRLRTQ